MLSKLLYLRDGELRRLLAFFGLYSLLFAAFALADGLSLAMFVKHAGSQALPRAYAIVAVANLVVIGLYIAIAERFRAGRVFRMILTGNIVAFGAAWIALHLWEQAAEWYAVLFVSREIAFTLLLMHFGTYLQDYFTRDEMNRVLPLIYSGGRIGGVLGGLLLQFLPDVIGLLNLLGAFVAMCAIGIVSIHWIDRVIPRSPPDHELPSDQSSTGLEGVARDNYFGFIRYVWRSPLLFWITVSTTLFMVCRWTLNYQYSSFFGGYFETDEELAEFLGLYTQIALLIAVVVQIFLINRLVDWLGLASAHLLYAFLVFAALVAGVGEMTLAMAVFARFVETELRFGLRNPINQLIINHFPRLLRVRVRGWSFGVLIPAGTLLSSILLASVVGYVAAMWIAWLGAGLAFAYVLWSFLLYGRLRKD